jgi:uncharacterized protein
VDEQRSFVERYGAWAVVLGASEGLGAAYAHGLAARGLNVVVAARRADLLDGVADEVARRHGVQTRAVVVDLGSPDLLSVLDAAIDGLDVGFVVYNGASGYVGPMKDQDVDSLRSIVAVNCTGPLLVCHHFGAPMIARGRGGIVVMGSAAGLAGAAYNSAYAASKAFDIVLGEALWAEWRTHNVDVMSVIGPAIDTPNYRAATTHDRGSMPAPMAPEAVVEEVLDALGSTPSFVPGEQVRGLLAGLGTLPRRDQVEALSAAHATFADRHETI